VAEYPLTRVRFVDKHSMHQILRPYKSYQVCCQWLAMCLLLISCETAVVGQTMSAQMSLDRVGLTSLWFTSAELGAGGKIIDWALDIDKTKSTTYIRIEAGPYREIISENNLDAFGKPFGLDGLVEHGEFRKEILEAELKSRKKSDKVTLTQYTLPKSTIYVLGNNSRVTSIDADSGRQNWSVGFGSLNHGCIGIHADNEFVVAANNSFVFCFDAATGKQMWSHACRFAVEAPPVVTQGKVFVPLVDGRLEVFEIANEGFGSYTIVGAGVPTSRPLVTSHVVAWSTNIGHLNFTGLDEDLDRSLLYRLKAGGRIDSTPAYRDKLIFTACDDGFVYAIKEDLGKIQWQSSVGTPVSQAPFVFGSRVYVVSDDQRMFCLDALTGELQWDEPVAGIGKYLGASRTRIYLTNGARTLLVIDPLTGRIVSRAEFGNVTTILTNDETDRLYVANNAGIIHCVHEVGDPVPYFHSKKLEVPKGKDPFAENIDGPSDNPFGEDSSDAAEAANQGGEDNTDDDPFGKKSSAPGKAPIKADESDDPFSSGGSDKNSDDGNPFSFEGSDDGSEGGDPPAGEDDTEPAADVPDMKSVVWKNVEPIFSKNCSKCHNSNQSKGGFDASSYSAVMSQGEALVAPGEGEASRLYRIINHEEEPAMPPGGKKLSKSELKKIKDWINDGALENQAAPVEGGENAPEDDDPFGS
jgi:outer membrane protein assembly factor BamB/mono/diheme cytochrome c family protein